MRLSWPRDDDKKRAATAGSPPMALSPRQMANLFFINTTWRDMELYRHLNLPIQPLHVVQTYPKLCGQPHIGANNIDLLMDLVNHCKLQIISRNRWYCSVNS